MFSCYKIFDYLIPIIAGIVVLVFALIGLNKTDKDDIRRKKIVKYLIIAVFMIIISFILIFM